MKLSDIPTATKEAEKLIKMQHLEIQHLRALLFRSYTLHGEQLQNGALTPPARNISFDFEHNTEEMKLVLHNSKETGIKSRGEEAEELYFKLM